MALSSTQTLSSLPFHSRKLLLSPSLNQSFISPPPNSHGFLQRSSMDNSFDDNIVMVIVVLVCALICSVGLNSIVNCAFRCSRLVTSDDNSRIRNGSSTSSGKVPSSGINKKALKKFPVVKFSPGDLKTPGLESDCVICLAEFSPGNKIRVLPKCNHGFHVKCIDKWLKCHSSCPTCRHCLIETCHKIVDGGDSIGTQSSSNAALPPGAPHELIVRIAPLAPEGMIGNFPS